MSPRTSRGAVPDDGSAVAATPAAPAPTAGDASGGGQVHRALAILELLGDPESVGLGGPEGTAVEAPTSFGVVEIARTLGRDKSQVSRLLRLLADAGFVEREAGTLRYRIGTRLFSLGVRAVSKRLRDEADALVEREAALLGERVEVCVRSGGSAMTVSTAAPDSELRAVGWVGRTVPLSCTAGGRALLFDLDTAAIARLIVPEGLTATGPAAPRSLDELVVRIAEDRARGWSLARHEMDRGLLSVGAPVRDAAGRVVAAVTVGGPDSRIDPVLAEVSTGVLRAAADLSVAIGAPGAPPAPPPDHPARPSDQKGRSVVNVFQYFAANSAQILNLTIQHAQFVFYCVAIGSIVSVAIGLVVSTGEPNPNRFSFDWWATGIREGSLLITAAVLTVPSLALFVLFLPITGLGVTTAIIVLTIYTLYTVLRNTVAGLTAVDRAVLESARGLGYGRVRRLLTIQLPLAWPVILNGIRVTTLISISIAVVASIVQGPGLGKLLLTGITRIGAANAFPQVLIGTVMCLVVAAFFEIIFAIVQRLTIPRGIRV